MKKQQACIERLFIYGTLAPGSPNHHIMADIPGDWLPASMKGKLVQEGWGAAQGYPGIIPCEDGEEVMGFVFSSKNLSEHWQRLDDFEGSGYQRVEVEIGTEQGETLKAYVYALNINNK